MQKVEQKWGSGSPSDVVYYLEDHCSDLASLVAEGRVKNADQQSNDELYGLNGICLEFQGDNAWPNFELHLQEGPAPQTKQPWPAKTLSLYGVNPMQLIPAK